MMSGSQFSQPQSTGLPGLAVMVVFSLLISSHENSDRAAQLSRWRRAGRPNEQFLSGSVASGPAANYECLSRDKC